VRDRRPFVRGSGAALWPRGVNRGLTLVRWVQIEGYGPLLMAKERIPIPSNTAAMVLFEHDHTCCVCQDRGLFVQIHHLNENPADNAKQNLAVLCLNDHNRTQTSGGFGRHLSAEEVAIYRDDWVARVGERRRRADELAIARMGNTLPQTNSADWAAPANEVLTAYLAGMPTIRRKAYAAARPRWDSGIAADMNGATYDVISVLEHVWLHLSAWYPPRHFGGDLAAIYISDFIARRFLWHRALNQPDGEGTSGTILGQVTAGGVMNDLALAISETVRALLVWRSVEDTDADEWERSWNLAGERRDGREDE
jgi:hypothetical protein